MFLLIFALVLTAGAGQTPGRNQPPPKGVELFEGKSFAGWEGDLTIFRIQDGAIVGGSLDRRVAPNEFLCTTKTYADFELRLKFKLLGGEGANAGIQFRTRRIPNHHEVSGYALEPVAGRAAGSQGPAAASQAQPASATPREGGRGDAPLPETKPIVWAAGKTKVLIIGGGSSHDFGRFFGGTDGATLAAAGFSVGSRGGVSGSVRQSSLRHPGDERNHQPPRIRVDLP